MTMHSRDRMTGADRAIAQYLRFTEYPLRDCATNLITDLLHWHRVYVDRHNPNVEAILADAATKYRLEYAEQGMFAPRPERWDDDEPELTDDELTHVLAATMAARPRRVPVSPAGNAYLRVGWEDEPEHPDALEEDDRS